VLCRPLGLRWPAPALNPLVRGVTGRHRVWLDLHVGCRSRRVAFGSPDAARRQKALRVVKCRHRSCGPAGSGSLGSVRGKPVRARCRDNTPPPRADPGDPKRVKRHERDTRRASAKTRSSVDHVKLGCSFFEKWVVRLKFGASRRSRPLAGANFGATSTPASCSRRSTTVRSRAKVRRVAVRVVYTARIPTRAAAQTAAPERHGRGASSALLRIAKPDAAGGCSGQSGSSVPFWGRFRAPVVRRDGGWCPIHRQGAPEIGDAGRAFSADGADGPSRAWRLPPRPSPSGRDRDRPRSD
jgi:hypothetical protein